MTSNEETRSISSGSETGGDKRVNSTVILFNEQNIALARQFVDAHYDHLQCTLFDIDSHHERNSVINNWLTSHWKKFTLSKPRGKPLKPDRYAFSMICVVYGNNPKVFENNDILSWEDLMNECFVCGSQCWISAENPKEKPCDRSVSVMIDSFGNYDNYTFIEATVTIDCDVSNYMCCCSHKPITRLYIISSKNPNDKSSNVLNDVLEADRFYLMTGSECIKKYMIETDTLDMLKQIKKVEKECKDKWYCSMCKKQKNNTRFERCYPCNMEFNKKHKIKCHICKKNWHLPKWKQCYSCNKK